MRLWIGLTQIGLAVLALFFCAWGVNALAQKQAERERTLQMTARIRDCNQAFGYASVGLAISASAFVIMTVVLVNS